ncbi:5-(carboxyamino)imidazole ribonucleotide synthase [Altererythrobacter salegens]|uniref:N5-carboxyaminoimidazole ribonucleotide synthase n=1 Tax=Croceibacterium salegens TaxID=1737568 RepID=A0A6I4SZY7_9SPHN|nr:5-(carboxyamino)imidazole ribonucleotide synthase [Croceibacterium salegens]MXO60597.1 5-(carboxyamino)imidazole ribonucleotide synthase [Croceibacterium salegens]
MIPAGGTIGILGGGQLGRMLAMAAAQIGYKCHAYDPNADSGAADVCADFTCAPWSDRNAMTRFAGQCDVVTYEFENVPVGPLATIPPEKLFPSARALEVAQDRLHEKAFAEAQGGRTAPYAQVDSMDDLIAAVGRLGTPGILKTRRDGYDGKGQWRIESAREAEGLRLPSAGLVYEGFVRFAAEFSVILVRGRDGEVRFWDSAQNVHKDGILATSTLPPEPVIAAQVPAARELAAKIASALGYVGVLSCEFFATENGPVFNEMAPRVHNSGHWTIEGAVTSQFENHVRAICGLPLGDTSLVLPNVEMTNLVGHDIEKANEILAAPGLHLHLYGKGEARAGRKMGHVTRVWA